MSSSPTAPTSTTASSTSSPSRVALIACGAIAQPCKEIVDRRSWPVDVHPLPPLLHNQPQLIAGAVRRLATELRSFDQVDLVTHDWGAILALRVLAGQPANVRSWVSDMGDLGPDFQWHDTAKTWQTPGDGEALMDVFVEAPLADRALILQGVGVPEAHATEMATHLDRTMADAILVLYRSATDVGNEWGPGIDDITAPGLLVESMQDPFRSAGRVRRLAERTGAAIATMPDAGHFWMLDDPSLAAATITDFWATR